MLIALVGLCTHTRAVFKIVYNRFVYDTLHKGPLLCPPIQELIFIELMEFDTCSMKFSFNNVMYEQIEIEAIGKPLGPSLGFHVKCSFQQIIHLFLLYLFDETRVFLTIQFFKSTSFLYY